MPHNARKRIKIKSKITSVNNAAVGTQLHCTTQRTQKQPGGYHLATPQPAVTLQDARQKKQRIESVDNAAVRVAAASYNTENSKTTGG
jgi:hypothetical protein